MVSTHDVRRRCGVWRVAWLLVSLLAWFSPGEGRAQHRQEGDKPPTVYIHLVMSVDDHINHEFNERRLDRTLTLVDEVRRARPDLPISCLYVFTGASAATLEERRSNHLLERLRDAVARGVAEVGYDGTEEPTPAARPRPHFRGATTAEARWQRRVEALDWFLTEGKHPRTGEPDSAAVGGLARVVEVFGRPAAVWGVAHELGGDPELVHLLDRLGAAPLMPGLPTRDAPLARHLYGYRGRAAMFATLVSPTPDTAPELYWQDHMLRLSDTTADGTSPVIAHEGRAAFERVLARLDPARRHVVRVRLGDAALYARVPFGRRLYTTPLDYAYDNPREARLPAEAIRDDAEIDAGFAREADLVRWLADEWLPARHGSRFVGVADLHAMTASSRPGVVRLDDLIAALPAFLLGWDARGGAPPDVVRVGDADLSLAEAFAVLTHVVAARGSGAGLPQMMVVPRAFGPLDLGEGGADTPRTVTAGAVVAAAAHIDALFASAPRWEPFPQHIVPSRIGVDGREVNAATFLRLLGEALGARSLDEPIVVMPAVTRTGITEAMPWGRPPSELGASWTVKPARIVWKDTSGR